LIWILFEISRVTAIWLQRLLRQAVRSYENQPVPTSIAGHNALIGSLEHLGYLYYYKCSSARKIMIHHGTSSLSHFDRHAASPRATTGLGSRVCVGVWVGDIRLSSFAGVCAHVKEGSCQSGLELDRSCRRVESPTGISSSSSH
jgi:hypothetical protein